MEFEEFARQFRARTTQRMEAFEKALGQAQERMEKSVENPGQRAQPPQYPKNSQPLTPDLSTGHRVQERRRGQDREEAAAVQRPPRAVQGILRSSNHY